MPWWWWNTEMPPTEVPPHSAPIKLPPKQLKRSGCKRLSRSISNNSSATWQTSICFKVRFRVVAPQVCRYPRESQNCGSFFWRLFVTPFWTLFFSAQPLAHQNNPAGRRGRRRPQQRRWDVTSNHISTQCIIAFRPNVAITSGCVRFSENVLQNHPRAFGTNGRGAQRWGANWRTWDCKT